MKKSKSFMWLCAVILFLLLSAFAWNAFLDGNMTDQYYWQCQNKECSVQTRSLFGLGKDVEEISFAQNSLPILEYSDSSRLPHYYLRVDGKRLPMDFYFSKTATHFIDQLQSNKDFSGNAYSLMLQYWLFVLLVAFVAAAVVILFQKPSANSETKNPVE